MLLFSTPFMTLSIHSHFIWVVVVVEIWKITQNFFIKNVTMEIHNIFPISNFKEHLLRLGGTHLVANIVPWFLSSFCIASKGRVSCTVLRHFFIKQSFNQEKMSCKLCPLFSQLTHPDQRFCKGNENLFKGNNLAAWNQMCRKCFRE